MKRVISILFVGVVVFLTSCGFHNTSEENRFVIQNDVSKSVEEQIANDDLFGEEEAQDTYKAESEEYIVYRTRTGKKYHSSGCRYLSQSCIEVTFENAEYRGLKACSVCQP